MAPRLSFVLLLIAFAFAGRSYAAESSSPSPPTMTSNTTGNSPPMPPAGKNSTDGQDYSDYEVPLNLAPGGVEVVEDYAPINTVKGADELAQPEEDLSQKTSQPVNSASYFSSSSYVIFVVAAGLFLF
ncbi:hypothetical protein EUTSA_v10028025mg [Eutrema salsugineum]|uniref:Uncharacterized protein n=1 Tax=Eutrema salsugineum TaxID=72664 RepID=V4NKJ7_EUTSA|nr:uncharacterized protein LOC18023044 [Eutrema salsugineum]ESQ46906.1 hypothetical protein EUTSA_v10028025mg [Eutrema salsugineum]